MCGMPEVVEKFMEWSRRSWLALNMNEFSLAGDDNPPGDDLGRLDRWSDCWLAMFTGCDALGTAFRVYPGFRRGIAVDLTALAGSGEKRRSSWQREALLAAGAVQHPAGTNNTNLGGSWDAEDVPILFQAEQQKLGKVGWGKNTSMDVQRWTLFQHITAQVIRCRT